MYANGLWPLCCSFLAADDISPPQRCEALDDGLDPDQEIDFDEEHDSADKGPLPDMDMEEEAQNLTNFLNNIPSSYESSMNAADIEGCSKTFPCSSRW